MIDIYIYHDVAVLPDQIQKLGDLVHDVLCYYPFPCIFFKLRPFVALPERVRHIDWFQTALYTRVPLDGEGGRVKERTVFSVIFLKLGAVP